MKVFHFLILFLSFNALSNELSLFEQCVKSKSSLKESNIDDLSWKKPKEVEDTFPIINLWERRIPIVPNKKPLISNGSYDQLILLADKKDRLQQIINNTFLSNDPKSEMPKPFEALLESFSIKLNDVNCDLFKTEHYGSPLFLTNTHNLSLLMLKATFKNPDSKAVYKTPKGFVESIGDTLFVHHAIHKGVSSSSTVGTQYIDDIHIYVNTLNKAQNKLYHNETLEQFIKVVGSKSLTDWQELQLSLKEKNAPKASIDAIDEAIEHLTRH